MGHHHRFHYLFPRPEASFFERDFSSKSFRVWLEERRSSFSRKQKKDFFGAEMFLYSPQSVRGFFSLSLLIPHCSPLASPERVGRTLGRSYLLIRDLMSYQPGAISLRPSLLFPPCAWNLENPVHSCPSPSPFFYERLGKRLTSLPLRLLRSVVPSVKSSPRGREREREISPCKKRNGR